MRPGIAQLWQAYRRCVAGRSAQPVFRFMVPMQQPKCRQPGPPHARPVIRALVNQAADERGQSRRGPACPAGAVRASGFLASGSDGRSRLFDGSAALPWPVATPPVCGPPAGKSPPPADAMGPPGRRVARARTPTDADPTRFTPSRTFANARPAVHADGRRRAIRARVFSDA